MKVGMFRLRGEPVRWVLRPCDFCKGGNDAADTMGLTMPSGLHRTYAASPALDHVFLLPPLAPWGKISFASRVA